MGLFINELQRTLELNDPETGVRQCVRPLEFAYECPQCKIPIFGLMNYRFARDRKAPREFRLDSKPKSFIHLDRCFDRKTTGYVPPDFDGSIIEAANGEMGQLFRETKHFGKFEQPPYGTCRLTRVFRARSRAELLRLLFEEVLTIHKATNVDAPRMRKALREPELFVTAWEYVGSNITEAPDVFGKRDPLYLVARGDFHLYDLQTWCRRVVAEYREREYVQAQEAE